jgi:hypothetical protein
MLTDIQKSSARHDGGKTLANKKRHLAQTRSALLSVVKAIQGEYTTQQLVDAQVTPKDLDTLRAAAGVLACIEDSYARDAEAARRIQAQYEADLKAATLALHSLITDKIADTIALYAVALPRETPALRELREDLQRPGSYWSMKLDFMQREAIGQLAYHLVTRQGGNPQSYCAALAPQLADARVQHAELIARVKAHAVAQKIAVAA